MKDFLGNDIKAGMYLAKSGLGNRTAEYGMILYEVMEVSHKIRVRRICSKYVHSEKRWEAYARNNSISESTKYVVVTPSMLAHVLFQDIANNCATQNQKDLAAKWLHGKQIF